MQTGPIGIFDSGVGGLTIWTEIHRLLPHEDTLYLADSANAPYGERPPEEIIALSVKNTDLLLAEGCKLVVVACNTATTNAITYLRNAYSVPFVGIEPAIKPAALHTRTKVVGVLATRGTLSSSLFHSTSENHAHGIRIVEQVGTGLVPLIEAGKINSPEMWSLLEKYVQNMLDEGADCIVLGCTHYPFLMPLLRRMLPATVRVIDSGEAVARQTGALLRHHFLSTPFKHAGQAVFYTNADPKVMHALLADQTHDAVLGYRSF